MCCRRLDAIATESGHDEGSAPIHGDRTGSATHVINYRAVPKGPNAYDLVFVSFNPGDYSEMNAPRPAPPRKKLVPDKSVVARIYLEDGKSPHRRRRGRPAHRCAAARMPDHSYGCMQ